MLESTCPPLGSKSANKIAPATQMCLQKRSRDVAGALIAPRNGRAWTALFAILSSIALAFSGCSANPTGATLTDGLQVTPGSLSFGSVTVGKTVTANLSLVNLNSSAIQISNIQITGSGFTAKVQNPLPITVAAAGGKYALTVSFTPTVSGPLNGMLTISTDATANATSTVALNGTGMILAPVLNAFTCSSGAIPELGFDSCTVTLSAAAATGGMEVSITSNSAALSVPTSVMVAAGATSANFQATASSVTTPQNVILTASAGGVSDNTDVTVEVANPSLTLSTTSVSFGSEPVSTPTSQTVKINSTGAAAVTITSVTVSGSGFSVSAPVLPMTLSPGSSASLTVQFDPSVAGPVSGQIAIASDSSSANAVSLSGTGVPVLTGVSCSNGSITGSGTDSCAVALNAAAASGGFTVGLSSNDAAVTVPSTVTVPAGSTTGTFTATIASVTTTQTATLTASTGSTTKTFAVTLNALVPTLTGVSCTSSSLTGSVSDSCTVTLNTAAATGGLQVNLSSNNANVAVPASVTVAAGSTTARFSATASAVTTGQSATLTATAGTATKTFGLTLNAYVATLSVNSTTIAFGSVPLNTPSTQSLILTSTGAAPVTVSTVTIAGAGYTFSGATFPLTLNTSKPSATLSVQFEPTVTGTQNGTLIITNNSSNIPNETINLSGSGGTSTTYEVDLSWTAPSSSPDPVASYNVYRSPTGQSQYQLMGSVKSNELAYADTTNVQDGQTYDYIVESVDSSGNESIPSNTATVQIP